MIQTFSFTTRTLQGNFEQVREMVRQVAATYFGECVNHFDNFEYLTFDYNVVENIDGTVTRTTTADIGYDDELDDDDDGFPEDDGLAGAYVPSTPYPFTPSAEAANDLPFTFTEVERKDVFEFLSALLPQ